MPIRALKIAVIVMGVMIVLGTGTLVALILRRAAAPFAAAPAAVHELVLEEPPGTRIAGVAATQDRLAVSLQGGGPDRLVLVDPRSLMRAGTVRLAH